MMTGLYNTLIASASSGPKDGSARAPQLIAGRIAADPGSGNAAPASGKDLPGSGERTALSRVDVERAVERLQELARNHQRGLRFAVDEGSGRTVITVINAATNEVVRQIPSEEILAIARAVHAQRVGLVAEQA